MSHEIGTGWAKMLALTGRRIDAATAERLGIVQEVTTLEDLRPAALALAQEIARNAPLAVQSTRASLRLGDADAIEARLRREYREQRRLMRTADFAEGVAALRERRAGDWIGA